jgi:hypothetical protein
MYKCPRCSYSSSKKTNMKTHCNRKVICKNIYSDEDLQEYLSKIYERKKFNCEYCEKIFTRKTGLTGHTNICKVKIKIEKLKEEKDKEIKILKENFTNANVSTIVNNNNCTTNNQQINIIINSFKDTDYTGCLTNKEVLKCLKDKNVPEFDTLIDSIHFNKDKPENHNIYIANRRTNKILTYDGDKFIEEPDSLMDLLLNKLESTINNTLDSTSSKVYFEKLKSHIKHRRDDYEYDDATKDEMARALYNGRTVVTNTHKLK